MRPEDEIKEYISEREQWMWIAILVLAIALVGVFIYFKLKTGWPIQKMRYNIEFNESLSHDNWTRSNNISKDLTDLENRVLILEQELHVPIPAGRK